MGAALGHFVDHTDRNACRRDGLGRALRGHELKAQLHQLFRYQDGTGFVAIFDGEKNFFDRILGAWQLGARSDLTLHKRFSKCLPDPHHFARGLHLWAQNRIDSWEFHKREHRLFDAEVGWCHLAYDPLRGQTLTHHAARCDFGELNTGGFGDKGDGSGGARIDLEHKNHILPVLVLNGKLHVHESHHVKGLGHGGRLTLDLLHRLGRQGIGWQRASRVAAVHTRLLDVLHHTANEGDRAVSQTVHIALDGIVQKSVQKNGGVVRDLDGFAHVALQIALLVHDLHGAASQHIAWAHHQGVAEVARLGERLFFSPGRGVGGLPEPQVLQHLLKTLAVFGRIDHVGARADDGHTRRFKPQCQLQGRLSAVLHNHPQGLFALDNLQHIFQRQGLKVEPITRVVIGGNRLGIAVDHDGLIAIFSERHGRVHAAVIKLNALANSVGTPPQDHDFFGVAGVGLALLLVGGVKVSGVGLKLGRTGVNALINGAHPVRMSVRPHLLLAGAKQLGHAPVREAFLLELTHLDGADVGERGVFELELNFHNLFNLIQEPRIDAGERVDFSNTHTERKRVPHIPNALRTGCTELTLEDFSVLGLLVHAVHTHFEPSEGLLERLLEGSPHGHHLTHRFHLRGEPGVGLGKFLKRKTRDLRHHIVNARLKGCRRLSRGDVVFELIKGVAHGEFGRHFGYRETRGFGGQGRGA